jgi:hypothetical protein
MVEVIAQPAELEGPALAVLAPVKVCLLVGSVLLAEPVSVVLVLLAVPERGLGIALVVLTEVEEQTVRVSGPRAHVFLHLSISCHVSVLFDSGPSIANGGDDENLSGVSYRLGRCGIVVPPEPQHPLVFEPSPSCSVRVCLRGMPPQRLRGRRG